MRSRFGLRERVDELILCFPFTAFAWAVTTLGSTSVFLLEMSQLADVAVHPVVDLTTTLFRARLKFLRSGLLSHAEIRVVNSGL